MQEADLDLEEDDDPENVEDDDYDVPKLEDRDCDDKDVDNENWKIFHYQSFGANMMLSMKAKEMITSKTT
jgi:hypothetical protein